MANRAEQKARTRNALIDSWLGIIGSGVNFASISLREVAKAAGVVPTSFYRHFDDMDELGLAVVDELGLDLRRLTRGSFDASQSMDDNIGRGVGVYQRYVVDNAESVEFVNQARTGGTPALRGAIDSELSYFSTRIAGALRALVPGLKPNERDTVAQLILAVLLENTTALLAVPTKSRALQGEFRQELEDKMRVIMLGAEQLVTASAPKRKPRQTPHASAL